MSDRIERITADIPPRARVDAAGAPATPEIVAPVREDAGDLGVRDAVAGLALPNVVTDAGEHAAKTFVEYFAARIANPRTRRAYATAIGQFMRWCGERNVALRQIEPLHVATYIRSRRTAKPTVNQHLAAIRTLCNWLVVHQVIRQNPAAAVKGPRQSSSRGSTPVLTREQARRLLDSIDGSSLAGSRDLAFISTMLYSFARVSAVAGMRVLDYYRHDSQHWLRLQEKGGRRHDVPAHHKAAQALDRYIDIGGLKDPLAPLFQSLEPRCDALTGRPWSPRLARYMVKRRAEAADLPPGICCHSFRATGITTYLGNGGSIEEAQRIAGHRSPRTTKLYDRNPDTVTITEIEKIVI